MVNAKLLYCLVISGFLAVLSVQSAAQTPQAMDYQRVESQGLAEDEDDFPEYTGPRLSARERLRFMMTGSTEPCRSAEPCRSCGNCSPNNPCGCYVRPRRLSFWQNAEFLFFSGVYGQQNITAPPAEPEQPDYSAYDPHRPPHHGAYPPPPAATYSNHRRGPDMTALGYGIEMFGDAFGPGMSTRVVGSGKVNYNSSNVYYSPGGDYSAPGYIVKDLTGSSGRPITQPGTEYAWKVGTIPDGAGGKSIDYDFYPNGPEEVRAGTRTTTIQDPSKPYQNITVPVYEPSEGRTLRDYAEQELPGHVSIDRENTSVVIPPLYSQEPATARFAYNYEIPETVFVRNVLGRVKVSENMSPIPKTRFILDYNYFDEAPITNGQAGVNRLTPGLEWAFLKDIASLEVRIPVGWTVNSRQSVDGLGNEDIGTIGDVTFYLKMLHCKTKRFALSSGMGVSLPTGKDRALADSEFPSRNFLEIENKSVHLMPFVGLLYTPDDTFFSQLFAQCDVNACSDDVLFYDYVNTGSMQRFAKWHEGFYVYISGMVGRWLYKDFSKRHGINGLNVSAEVHWTQSLGTMRNIKGSFVSPDGLSSESITIYRRRTEEYLNLTLGTHLLVNQRNNIGFGFCVPLFNQKQFDFETRITFSHHF